MRNISAMFGIPYSAWKVSIPPFIIQIIIKNIVVETSPAFYLHYMGRRFRLSLEKNVLSLANVRYTAATLSAI